MIFTLMMLSITAVSADDNVMAFSDDEAFFNEQEILSENQVIQENSGLFVFEPTH